MIRTTKWGGLLLGRGDWVEGSWAKVGCTFPSTILAGNSILLSRGAMFEAVAATPT